ncbi:MAG: flavin reductase family protein [Proteobacteria bacterium]|nr:flavin reductase family protein [Pseudomonadota bacterium]
MSFALADSTRQFRNALGSFATGVTIITTVGPDGSDVGVTANSFNSVSLDPPMILWSLGKNSTSLAAFMAAEHFVVHVLAMDQEALSGRFARSTTDKFAGLTVTRGVGGVPLLPGCAARFHCRTAYRHEGGDHIILVGEVEEFDHDGHAPLAFHGGRYGMFIRNEVPSPDEAAAGVAPLLSDLLARAEAGLGRRIDADVAAFGLAPHEFDLLRLLAAGPRSLEELEELAGPAGETAAVVLVEDLAARGLVSPPANGTVVIAAAGQDAVTAVTAQMAKTEAAALEALTPHEAALLRRFLTRLVRTVDG